MKYQLIEFEIAFKALADKQRLRILGLLSQGPLVVNDIRSVLKLSMSTVSQHLSILKSAGLIVDSKKGRWVEYSITEEVTSSYSIVGSLFPHLDKYFRNEQKMQFDIKDLKKLAKPDYDRPTMAHRKPLDSSR
jgi:DNA-binding transcriptional ArsR family regulator